MPGLYPASTHVRCRFSFLHGPVSLLSLEGPLLTAGRSRRALEQIVLPVDRPRRARRGLRSAGVLAPGAGGGARSLGAGLHRRASGGGSGPLEVEVGPGLAAPGADVQVRAGGQVAMDGVVGRVKGAALQGEGVGDGAGGGWGSARVSCDAWRDGKSKQDGERGGGEGGSVPSAICKASRMGGISPVPVHGTVAMAA